MHRCKMHYQFLRHNNRLIFFISSHFNPDRIVKDHELPSNYLRSAMEPRCFIQSANIDKSIFLCVFLWHAKNRIICDKNQNEISGEERKLAKCDMIDQQGNCKRRKKYSE